MTSRWLHYITTIFTYVLLSEHVMQQNSDYFTARKTITAESVLFRTCCFQYFRVIGTISIFIDNSRSWIQWGPTNDLADCLAQHWTRLKQSTLPTDSHDSRGSDAKAQACTHRCSTACYVNCDCLPRLDVPEGNTTSCRPHRCASEHSIRCMDRHLLQKRVVEHCCKIM